ncbi:CPBP family intramembrane glutamic endopeptidase [Nonomuraea sp. NPDC049649]|uniref:CPBP family intramembrane glutamic endopeptidase n=1 Tax=Nonomuraea sp. NPDC049649 TaxID=3155776 RepID=UPI003446AB9D
MAVVRWFFALVFALAVPFWVAGAFTGRLPGAPMDLPLAALMFPAPLVAALVLVRRREGPGAPGRLLRASLVPGRASWLAVAVLVAVAVELGGYGLAAVLGWPVTGEREPLSSAPVLLVVFLISGFCEEAGWTTYATGPLRDRLGRAGAGLVLGIVWAVWHLVPLAQAGRAPLWIAWWFLGTVAARLIMVWVWDRSGEVTMTAVVFHALLNVGPSLLPGYAAHDSLVAATALTGATVAAVLFALPRRVAAPR